MSAVEKLQRFVKKYRGGAYRNDAEERVAQWLSMFDADHRVTIAAELVHVLDRSFLTRGKALDGVRAWLEFPKTISGGLFETWEETTFLNIQKRGGSQIDLHKLLNEEAATMGLLPVDAYHGDKAYVYADDLSVHGTRILKDLDCWLKSDAPDDFDLLLLLQRRLDRGSYVEDQLVTQARSVGKTVRVHWWCDQVFEVNDCYWPVSISADQEITTYIEKNTEFRVYNGTGLYFSSDAGRHLLETELLRAGVRILAAEDQLKRLTYNRPLGNTIWLKKRGLGLGVPIVTWRNCPNSAPLALWANGTVPPLFPRKVN